MVRNLLFLLFVLPLIVSCDATQEFSIGSSGSSSVPVLGTGVMMTETRSVPSFHGVELDAVAAVTISVGPAQSIRVIADDNILDHIRTRVSGGTLLIDSRVSYDSPIGVTVEITVPELNSVVLEGVGSFRGYGISAGSFRAILSGAGTISLQGSCAEFVGKLDGVGDIEAQALTCSTSRIVLSGRGDCRTTATQELDATISGVGDIYYSGNPPLVQSSITGSGRLIPY